MKILILFVQILFSIEPYQDAFNASINPNPNVRFDDPGLAFVMRKPSSGDSYKLSLYLDKKVYVQLSGEFSEELMLRIERDWKLNRSYNPYMIASLTQQVTLKQYRGKEVCELKFNDSQPDLFLISAGSDRLHFLVQQLDIIEVTRFLQAMQSEGIKIGREDR